MKIKSLIAPATLALLVSLAGPLSAQETGHGGGHGMTTGMAAAPKGDTGPSSTAFAEANAKMHAAMDIEFTGNADVDFVRGMIGHHQGAIDMARIVLEHGKDPEIRKLAGEIIAAQEAEVEMMSDWLAKHGQ